MNGKTIIVISDSLGETSTRVVKATLSQFDKMDTEIKTFNLIRTRDAAEDIIRNNADSDCIVVYTTVVEEVRDAVEELCDQYSIITHDIMTPIMSKFMKFFGSRPRHKPGSSYKLDKDYFERIAAIEFAVKYDDGKDLRGLDKSDIVLIGISRTSKTPLSMYLSHKTLKVANVPLVPEIPVPEEIFQMDKNKLIGLTNSPEKLYEIRNARLRSMGLSGTSEYASTARIHEEIKFAEDIYKRIGCPVINVANRAIEETASIILQITGLNTTN